MKKEVKYEREFISRKNNRLINEICAEEHNLFMEKFEEKFGNPNNFGFDGSLMYSYEINSTMKIPDYIDKKMPYKLIFTINQFGAPKELQLSSDLEYFLLDKGFKKI